ncbi:hypothetical protein JXA84_04735 [candidate division WOR-3 bacterium]|nr:hypothetical protein [candidate division WOR-3 bacterium]
MKLERITDSADKIEVHMARDEALFESAQNERSDKAIVRFYTTPEPSVTVGRNQRLGAEFTLKCLETGVKAVRRLTGGRAVPHANEVTYCLVAPVKEMFSGRVTESFMVVSERLVQGLRASGVEARISRVNEGEESTVSCFDAVGRHEITFRSIKLLGSAQYRKAGYLLQQGTLIFRKLPFEIEYILGSKNVSLEELQGTLPSWNQVAQNMFCALSSLFDGTSLTRDLTTREKQLEKALLDKYGGVEKEKQF